MSTPLLTVAGTLTIRERLAIPPGAVASVKLVDASGEVLAGTAVVVDGVPAAFELAADPLLVPDASKLLLWAALRTEVGTWGTPDLVAVDDETVELVLTKIED